MLPKKEIIQPRVNNSLPPISVVMATETNVLWDDRRKQPHVRH